MRFFLQALVAGALVAAVNGCSSLSVYDDYDSNADFNGYRTYGWAESAEMKAIDSLNDTRIKRAIDAQMSEKGFVKVEAPTQPNVFVTYHVSFQDKFTVYDDRWVTPRGWTYGGSVSVNQYTEGTLVVDLIDAQQRQLVWRGWATASVDPSPSNAEERINTVVKRILAQYPPR